MDRTAESAALILLRQLTTLARETTERPVADTGDRAHRPVRCCRDGTPEESRGGVAFANCASWWRRSVEKSQRDADAQQAPDGSLRARPIAAEEIWDPLNELIDADRTALCVFAVATWTRLHCSAAVSSATEEQLRAVARHAGGTATSAESVKGERPARAIIGAHRDLFLRYELASAEWRLVTSEDRALALAPASSVTTSLCLLFALAMVSAFAFAHQQIRRSTQPLEALRDATRRVEAGDLDTPGRDFIPGRIRRTRGGVQRDERHAVATAHTAAFDGRCPRRGDTAPP